MTCLFMAAKTKKKPDNRTVVLTGGTFNSLHLGHEYLLKKSKTLGDYLVVVLANDKHDKKPNAVPAKLRIADKVVVGSPNSFVGVVHRFKPKIIVLGYDQKLPDGETKKAAKKMKIKVVRCGRYKS